MPRILFGLVEVVMVVLFVLSARFAYRSGGRQRLNELLSAVPFGLLLEQGDIKIFGSYAYNQGFFLKLGSVPLAIALAIRQGLWHWNIPLHAGFFGVPAGNYYGWLFVAFGFSAWTRWVRVRAG